MGRDPRAAEDTRYKSWCMNAMRTNHYCNADGAKTVADRIFLSEVSADYSGAL
jgi:hypothetical protein